MVAIYLCQSAHYAIAKSGKAKREEFRPTDEYANSVAFDFLIVERYEVVSQLNQRLQKVIWTASTMEHLKVNSWLAKKKLLGLQSIEKEVSAWDVSLSSRMRLGKHCLLDELDDASDLLERLIRQEEISEIDRLTWPILEDLRNHETKMNDTTSVEAVVEKL